MLVSIYSLCIYDMPNFFFFFLIFLVHTICLQVFFQIAAHFPKKLFNIFVENKVENKI